LEEDTCLYLFKSEKGYGVASKLNLEIGTIIGIYSGKIETYK